MYATSAGFLLRIETLRITLHRPVRRHRIVRLVTITRMTRGGFGYTEFVGQHRGFVLSGLLQFSRPARDERSVLADDGADAYRGAIGTSQHGFNLAVSRIMRLTDPALGRAQELAEPLRSGRDCLPSIDNGIVRDPLFRIVFVGGAPRVAGNPRSVKHRCYLRIRIAVGVILFASPCRHALPVLR
jgi:hypothetical protein